MSLESQQVQESRPVSASQARGKEKLATPDDSIGEDRYRPDYSFHLEINEVAKDYLSFRLDYGYGVTSGAMTLEHILDAFRETVKGVIQTAGDGHA